MAFKIKNPLHFDGTVNPSKKLETNKPLTKKDSPDFAKSGVGSKIITNEQYRDSGKVPKGMESTFSGKGTLRVSKSFTGKKSSGQGEGAGRGSGKVSSSTTGAYGAGGTAESLLKGGSGKKVTKDKTPPPPPPKETKASRRQSKLSQTSLGKKGKQKKFGDEVTMQSTRNNKKSTPKENTLDAINKVSMKEFIPASKKTTTVKAAPKDNSRKAIKARKTADKKAGVSKSQMRANKAKSKSEAASAKAKKSKNPSYRAQLTAKSERLAKRAKRKGNS
jgi:hypothetical protein